MVGSFFGAVILMLEGVVIGVQLQRSGKADEIEKAIKDRYNDFIKSRAEAEANKQKATELLNGDEGAAL